MKTLWTTIALTGFISISLFGLLSINHQGGHMAECLASKLNGSNAPCPEADPLGFASFHSDAFKKISNLIVVDGGAALLYVLTFIILFLTASHVLSIDNSSFKGIRIFNSVLPITSYQLLVARNWFSLHENSPSFPSDALA